MRLRLPSRGPGWTPYWKMVLEAPYEFWCGVRYGFPFCCIAHYCLDNLLYRLSADERGVRYKAKLNQRNEDGAYVPCARCNRLDRGEKRSVVPMPEVKKAVLLSKAGGDAILILVTEDYEIEHLSADIETLRLILRDRDVPNIEWRHMSDHRIYLSDGAGYQGFHHSRGIALVDQYKREKVAS